MSDSVGDGGGGTNKNKRKSLYDIPIEIFSHSSLQPEEVTSELGSSQVSQKNFQKLKLKDHEWNDPIVRQLLELLANHLQDYMKEAIKKIVDKGYTKESAEQLLFRSGLYHGLKDVTSNAVDGALAFAREGKTSGLSEVFQDIDKMVEFCLLEMVYVVRHIKPERSPVVEAMWSLLVCDLNLMHALALNKDELGFHSVQDLSGDTLSDSSDEEEIKEHFKETFYSGHISKLLDVKRNPVDCAEAAVKADMSAHQKGSLADLKREMLQHMLFCSGKNCKGHMCKVSLKDKLSPAGSNALDKVLKFSPGCSAVVMKSRFTKLASRLGARTPVLDGNGRDLRDSRTSGTDSPLPVVVDKVPASLSLKSKSIATVEANNDESMGACISKDDKDEIQGLLCEMDALQKEHQQWTNWANEKVMQATRRLAKEQAELKRLRQRKNEGDKLNQTAEEIRRKRLSEMDQALFNAAAQHKNVRLAFHKVEDENSVLKNEEYAANEKSDRSIYELCEASKEYEEIMKKFRSADLLKVSSQEELGALRHRMAGRLSQVKISRDREEQHEVLERQDEAEKLKYAEDVMRKMTETERRRAQAKAKVDRMREESERFTQRCKKEIKKLDAEISKYRSLTESPRLQDPHESGRSGFSSTSLENLTASSSKAVEAAKRLQVFQGIFGGEDIMEPERECIMCLSEETCVFFIPCAHQVLCSECNTIHEKQGMSDCPSCRKPIQARISVEYVDAWERK